MPKISFNNKLDKYNPFYTRNILENNEHCCRKERVNYYLKLFKISAPLKTI